MSRAFRIDMNSAQENNPLNNSTATGLGVAVFDDSGVNPFLDYTIVTRGVDWGPFTGQPAQTAATADNVSDAHYHQATFPAAGPPVFHMKPHDLDDFSATNLHLEGGVPVATVRGIWETTDPVNISAFAASFTNPALTLGSMTNLYVNVHTTTFPGGEIRGQLVLLSTDNGETITGVAGTRDDILPGLGGDDTISGLAGNDTLDGGSGNDLLDENDGKTERGEFVPGSITEINTLIGGAGADTLFGSPGPDTLDGGTGNDLLYGRSNHDTYRFHNSYGIDQLVDYNGRETLDFSGVSSNLVVTVQTPPTIELAPAVIVTTAGGNL